MERGGASCGIGGLAGLTVQKRESVWVFVEESHTVSRLNDSYCECCLGGVEESDVEGRSKGVHDVFVEGAPLARNDDWLITRGSESDAVIAGWPRACQASVVTHSA